MSPEIPAQFLDSARAVFLKQESFGRRAIAQLDEPQLFVTLDDESNSVAIIVKHMHGNMRSRWTDFLTTDGEKPDRGRDDEFVTPQERSRAQVLEWWENGWDLVFGALASLTPADVASTVRIRAEPMSVMAAVMRQIDHYGQHVGQIIFLAKHLAGKDWQTLSIPRGKSEEFNAKLPGR